MPELTQAGLLLSARIDELEKRVEDLEAQLEEIKKRLNKIYNKSVNSNHLTDN